MDWNGQWSALASEAVLQNIDDLKVVVFEPGGVPSDDRANRSTDVPKMTQGKAVLVDLMHRYLSGLLDPFVTLLEVHKLMYFMQVAGEPLTAEIPESALRTVRTRTCGMYSGISKAISYRAMPMVEMRPANVSKLSLAQWRRLTPFSIVSPIVGNDLPKYPISSKGSSRLSASNC